MTVNIDADLRNADWIRTLNWDLPTDKDMFLAVIGGQEQLAHFMTLPAAEAMPEQLKTELGLGATVKPADVSPHKPHPSKRLRVVPKDDQ